MSPSCIMLQSCAATLAILKASSRTNPNTSIVRTTNTFAKISRLERASVVELLSTTTTTHNLREALYGHCSTFPMPPTPCDGDDSPPMQSDGVSHAGHDGADHDVGPVPMGRQRGQLSDHATFFLHRAPVGHAVLGVLSSACVPSRRGLPAGGRCSRGYQSGQTHPWAG